MADYLLEFEGAEEVTRVPAKLADALAKRYVGEIIVFKEKDHKIREAIFDPTRGIVFTDSNGETFVYAIVAGTTGDSTEEEIKEFDPDGEFSEKKEPNKMPKTKRLIVPRKKAERYPTQQADGKHYCHKCGKRVPEGGHTVKMCEKLNAQGGGAAKNKKHIPKKKAGHLKVEREESHDDVAAKNEDEIIREAATYIDPLIGLSEQELKAYLLRLGLLELQRRNE